MHPYPAPDHQPDYLGVESMAYSLTRRIATGLLAFGMFAGIAAAATAPAWARYCSTTCYNVGNQRVCNTYCY